MPEQVIVWDLETVPDLEAFAAVADLQGKPEDEAVENGRVRILRGLHYGGLWLSRGTERRAIARFATPQTGTPAAS